MSAKSDSSSTSTFTPLQQKILAALQERIEPTRTTTGYKLGLFAVAVANLLLPLLYFGLIFLIAHALYWHARYTKFGPDSHWLLYLGMYLLGGATLVFLIKPIFVRGAKEARPLKLKRSSEPFLYEYVEAICRSVNAPVPKSIRLDCESNASAGFQGGLPGILTGRMVLTIGLPLLAGMSVRQMTGILAHEFGHFSQKGGMRLSYVVRTVNFWLMKIVFLRDAWDEKLEQWAKSGDSRVYILLQATRFCVWLSRQLLFGLVWLGNAISCFLMRQMEFDADRYEAQVVGYRTFISSCGRLTDLSIAHQMAFNDLRGFHSEGRLADDLPALIVSNVPHITPEFRKAVRKMELMQQTGLFDSHPTNRERIESVRKDSSAGVFQLTGEDQDPPATVLFNNFERLCRTMTAELYQTLLGEDYKKSLLHPVKQMIARREAEYEAGKSLDRYFRVHIPVDRQLPLYESADKPPANPQAAVKELKEAREEMLQLLVEYKNLPERYDTAEVTLYSTVEALSVLECGLKIRGAEFGLSDGSRKTAEAKNKRARAAVQHLAARMLVFETAASERLSAALQLIHVPKLAAAMRNGEDLQAEVRELVPSALLISEIIGGLPTLRIMYRRTHVLFSKLGKQQDERVVESIVGQLEGMSTRLTDIHRRLKNKRYPFDHADDTMTLQQFVIPHLPEPMDLGGIIMATQYLVERLLAVQVRLFARLTQLAEQVEFTLGLPSLPELAGSKKDEA